MNINIRIPEWAWAQSLARRIFPGLAERSEIFGTAKSNRRYLGGIIDITATAEVTHEGDR